MSARKEPVIPVWARFFRKLNEACLFSGSWKPLAMSSVINFQKSGTALFLALLMYCSYGMLWYMKDKVFPDPNWRRSITPFGAFTMFALLLVHYWGIGWIIMSGRAAPAAALPLDERAWCALAVALHTLGCSIMGAADAQKYFTLAHKKGLITSGMFAYIRHPNYLGEMMVYGSYGLLAWHPYVWSVLLYAWVSQFAVNMLYKEASMSRYSEWAVYRKRSWWLIPGVF